MRHFTFQKEEITSVLQNRISELKKAIKITEENLQELPENAEKLKIIKNHGCYQFYCDGKYTSKQEIDTVKLITQRCYYQKALYQMTIQLKSLEKALQKCKKYSPENVISRMSKKRRELLGENTLTPTDEDYAKTWQPKRYNENTFYKESKIYITDRQEKVRSKSELLIANALNKNKIPYRYEYPINLGALGIIHPDFTCLNVRTRQEFIWEHFGLLDDSEYRSKMMNKIAEYQKSDFLAGKNLIITMESENMPIDVKNINNYINNFLK